MNDQAKRPAYAQAAPFVYRQVSFDLRAFDRLKEWQRHFQKREGRRVSNSETLSRLILNNPSPR